MIECKPNCKLEGQRAMKIITKANEALAGAAGFEPATYGFGDRRSTN